MLGSSGRTIPSPPFGPQPNDNLDVLKFEAHNVTPGLRRVDRPACSKHPTRELHNAVEKTFLYVEEGGREGRSGVLMSLPIIARFVLHFCLSALRFSWPKTLAIESNDTASHHNMLQRLSFDEACDLTAEANIFYFF